MAVAVSCLFLWARFPLHLRVQVPARGCWSWNLNSFLVHCGDSPWLLRGRRPIGLALLSSALRVSGTCRQGWFPRGLLHRPGRHSLEVWLFPWARGAAALLSLTPQSPAGDSRPTEPRVTGSALLSQRLHGLVPHGLAHEAPVTCLPLRGPQGRCHLCELLPFWTPAGLGLPRQDRPPLGTQCVSSRLCGPCLRLGPWGQHCPHPGPHPGLDWSPWDIPPLPRRCRRELRPQWGPSHQGRERNWGLTPAIVEATRRLLLHVGAVGALDAQARWT